jgi:hypothetical protein
VLRNSENGREAAGAVSLHTSKHISKNVVKTLRGGESDER